MTKSGIACEFSIEALLKGHKTAYLWTFTFADALDVDIGAKRWSCLVKDLRRRLGIYGVRAFELHPGGHGLHVHFVTPHRYNVNSVRYYSNHHDFGRINVVVIPAARASYIAKYLQKASRCPALKGKRLWSCVGFKEGSKVKNIEINSPLSREIKEISNEDIRKHFERRNWAVPTSPRMINFVKFIMANASLSSIEHRIGFTDYPACALDKVAGEDAEFVERALIVIEHRKREARRFDGYLAKAVGAEPDWERLAIIHENSKVDGILGRDEIFAAFEKLRVAAGSDSDATRQGDGV